MYETIRHIGDTSEKGTVVYEVNVQPFRPKRIRSVIQVANLWSLRGRSRGFGKWRQRDTHQQLRYLAARFAPPSFLSESTTPSQKVKGQQVRSLRQKGDAGDEQKTEGKDVVRGR